MSLRKSIGPAILITILVAGLYLAAMLYSTGQATLALGFLAVLTLVGFIYTSPRMLAYRYLFPGVAAAIVFVLFPLIYTISIGFTNFSSKNLLPFERATRFLLDETRRAPGGAYAMTLHADGNGYRVRLQQDAAVYVTPALALLADTPLTVALAPLTPEAAAPLLPQPLTVKDVIGHQRALKALTLTLPDKTALRMAGLRQFAPVEPVWQRQPDQTLKDTESGALLKPNFATGFYQTADGVNVQPGFKVNVGFANFTRIFTDTAFRGPFVRIFVWTVVFSAITVFTTLALGTVLAILLNWDQLRFRGVYRTLLFLPYAVPGFISILVFKGLFNNNFGEINLILNALFGIKPAWFSDTTLAKVMILIVNTWLGYPYMMVLTMGLIKAIPGDLYEASALAGAGPLTNFFRITLPLIIKPLTPLLVASFAFNFNNFVLISLLTGGRPDFLDTTVPAGTTDLLVSYTYRIAFEDSGQNFGLAAAISTLIFVLVASLSIINMRLTKVNK
ncbi:maltose/maltodextrin transport system permease protein [Actimicrobium sp. GrIS 1.19]|uniref:maltose ABC transporter permease MalF n=1 Tax=Actimicrobium sp. GrIS 1.19 TaxID=3071708 RepID=UPI002DFE4870|nr:maltose/maltodextrin transport system permease protein [Actimicrobium sp. GrIS 1.19]